MKKSNGTIAIAILLLLASCTHVEIAQWRGPERNGIYPEKNLLTQWSEGGPQLLWKYEDLGLGYSSAVVTSDKIFVLGTTCSAPETMDSVTFLYSFDINGKLLWKKSLGKEWVSSFPGPRSTLTIFDGLGYVVNGLGVLFCFDTENGNIVWTKDYINDFNGKLRNWGVLDNVIVDGDELYCTPAGKENNIVALDRKTGETIWVGKGEGEGTMYSTPILIEIGGKKVFINQPGKNLVALNAENGELVWKFNKKNENPSRHRTPLCHNGYLLIMDDFAQGSIMLKLSEDGQSTSLAWSNPNLFIVQGDAVVFGDRLYCGGKENVLYCVDWYTGKEIYSEKMKAAVSIIISAENMLYCYDKSGSITLVKPLDNRFEKMGSFKISVGNQLHYSHPVIKDGRLYIRHDNSLFVYNISK